MYIGTHTSHFCHQHRAPNFVISSFQGPSAELVNFSTIHDTGLYQLISTPAGKRMLPRSVERRLETKCASFIKLPSFSYSTRTKLFIEVFLLPQKLESALCRPGNPYNFFLSMISGLKHVSSYIFNGCQYLFN